MPNFLNGSEPDLVVAAAAGGAARSLTLNFVSSDGTAPGDDAAKPDYTLGALTIPGGNLQLSRSDKNLNTIKQTGDVLVGVDSSATLAITGELTWEGIKKTIVGDKKPGRLVLNEPEVDAVDQFSFATQELYVGGQSDGTVHISREAKVDVTTGIWVGPLGTAIASNLPAVLQAA